MGTVLISEIVLKPKERQPHPQRREEMPPSFTGCGLLRKDCSLPAGSRLRPPPSFLPKAPRRGPASFPCPCQHLLLPDMLIFPSADPPVKLAHGSPPTLLSLKQTQRPFCFSSLLLFFLWLAHVPWRRYKKSPTPVHTNPPRAGEPRLRCQGQGFESIENCR